MNFPGAVVVVSHDRFFVDKVATRLLIFEEAGHLLDFTGNWTIWQIRQQQNRMHPSIPPGEDVVQLKLLLSGVRLHLAVHAR